MDQGWLSFGNEYWLGREVTVQFRDVARSYGISVSDGEFSTVGERTLGGCMGPLMTSGSSRNTVDDEKCMAGVARRLNAEWILFGSVSPASLKYQADVQLVSAQGIARSATFQLSDNIHVPEAVREAWRHLTAPE
jgi:hypothetical protein